MVTVELKALHEVDFWQIDKSMPLLLFVLFAFPLLVQAQDSREFEVNSVIHPVVQKLEKPTTSSIFTVMPIAISTKSEVASEHVVAGISHLMAPWDFEAYRHFSAAAQADPDCLMAYWGISMSLGGLNHEFFDQRKAAVDRMLDLLEAGVGVDWERGFSQAAGRLYSDGVSAAAQVYRDVAEKFPTNIPAQVFGLILDRDGYSESGQPNLNQAKALRGLGELVKLHPENPAVISAWVMTQGESPLNSSEMRKEVMPFARKLERLYPNYPPFQLIATHIDARCGNASVAINYARRAVSLYEAYCAKDQVSLYDCPGLIRAQVYLAVLLAGKDRFKEAYEIADRLAAMEVTSERVFSSGASLLLWEGRSLGPRLALMKGTISDLDHGLELLKVLDDEQWFHHEDMAKKKSLAVSYRNALAYCIAVRKALLKADESAIESLYRELIQRVKKIDTESVIARKTSSYSEYLRARKAIQIYAVELRGMMAMRQDGAMKRVALTWFRSATDRQSRPQNHLPDVVLYPMENRIGECFLAIGEADKAAIAYREGLDRMSNHLGSLRGYRSALLKLGKDDAAEQVEVRIELIKK